MSIRIAAATCALAGLFALPMAGQKPAGTPKEPEPHKKPGGIMWAASIEAALAESAKDGRPVMTYWTFDT